MTTESIEQLFQFNPVENWIDCKNENITISKDVKVNHLGRYPRTISIEEFLAPII